eukprot:TRINITY_DN1341_c0_g4_i1.p1 TRINITY_DN1341_c0_g4~~TRINITY_DN1341_c0_g4_i1.p1  ORF type:complete len:230 (+),score=29.88 TRINITY_DN1341_c0_g4_i1:99-788(+)
MARCNVADNPVVPKGQVVRRGGWYGSKQGRKRGKESEMKKGDNEIHSLVIVFVPSDDTFISPVNVRRLLTLFDPEKPHYLGQKLFYNNYVYNSGGAGWIGSKAFMHKLAPIIESKSGRCDIAKYLASDVYIGECAKDIHVPATNVPGFYSQKPGHYTGKEGKASKYKVSVCVCVCEMVGAFRTQLCPKFPLVDFPISFHYCYNRLLKKLIGMTTQGKVFNWWDEELWEL